MSFWLLISSMLFGFIQFIITIKMYYISMPIFQSIAMVLYAVAQFSFYKFMILSEKD